MMIKTVTYLSLREENSRLAFEAVFRLAGCDGCELGPRRRYAVLAGANDRRSNNDVVAVTHTCLRCSVLDFHVTTDVTI